MSMHNIPILLLILIGYSTIKAYIQNSYCAPESVNFEDTQYLYNCVNHRSVAIACKTPVSGGRLDIRVMRRDGDYEYSCSQSNGQIVLKRSACYASDGKRLQPDNAVYGVVRNFYVTCQYGAQNNAEYKYTACIDDQGVIHQDGQQLTIDGVRYMCRVLEDEMRMKKL